MSAITQKRGGPKQNWNRFSRILLIILTIFSIISAPITLADPEPINVSQPAEQVSKVGVWGKITPVSGKIEEKTPLFGGLNVFEIIPSVQAQSSVCCKTPQHWCETLPESACCDVGGCNPGQKEELPCDQTDCELEYGCCIETCGEIVSMSECGFPGDHSSFRPFESCDDVSECKEGVCANTQSVPTQCRVDYWKNCGGSEIFYPGFSDISQVPACSGGSPATGAISGTVTDLGGSPLSGVTVKIYSSPTKTANTDSNGQFAITGILIGTYKLEATLSPYTSVENNSVNVITDGNTEVTFKIDTGTTVTTGDISGKVWDQYVGTPLEQAYVVWSEMGQSKGTYTDSNGNFVLYGIPSGSRTVTASKTGYVINTKSGTVNAGIVNSGFDITLQHQSGSASCGNSIIDYSSGETCDIGFDQNPGTSDDQDGNCTGYCTSECICPTSCSQIEGYDNSHECDFEWQCTDTGGSSVDFDSLILPLRQAPPFDDIQGGPIYGVPSNGESVICCDHPCYEIPECLIDSVIADSEALGEYCQCGPNYFEVSHNNDFCCGTNSGGTEYWGAVPCQNMITLNGSVTDSTSGAGIQAANIELYFGSVHKDTIPTGPDGAFALNLSIGRTYTFYVTKDGYSEAVSTYTVPESGPYTLQIELTPYDPCFGAGPTSINVTANIYQQGNPFVILTWEMDCQNAVSSYRIERYDHNTSLNEVLGTVGSLSFIDYNTIMNNTYTYTVTPSPSSISNTTSIDTGWEICEGKMSANHEFCANNTKGQEGMLNLRLSCSIDNIPQITLGGGAVDTSGTIGNCTKYGETTLGQPAICRMLSNTTTECLIPDDCESTGLGTPLDVIGKNVLGLYYNLDYGSDSITYDLFTCTNERKAGGTARNRYCYYDHSDTSVDACFSCSSSGSCFDYESQSACENDANTCMYGNKESTTCAWYSTTTYFGELGKGFCYQVGYERQDKCGDFCGSNAEGLFRNKGCDQTLCSKLGQCFSVESNGEDTCSTCSAKFCDSYGTNQAACNGGQDFTIQSNCGGTENSADSFLLSMDSCSREKCAWNGTRCIKDANDDGKADCSYGDVVCNSDIQPPRTSITSAPAFINHTGGTISFAVNDGITTTEGMRSFWCFNDQACCSPEEVEHDSGFDLVYTSENVPSTEGFYNITYYSIDKHNNTEELNHFLIYIDSIPPSFTSISHEVFNLTGNDERSIVWISLRVVDEQNFTECDFHLQGGFDGVDLTNPGPPYLTTDTQNLTLKFENRQADLSQSGLSDGTYTFTAECTDTALNTNTTTYTFYINRNNKIFDVWPNQTVNAGNLRFILYASDDYAVCKAVEGSNEFTLNPTIVPHQYASPLVTIPEGDHSFQLFCYNQTSDMASGNYEATSSTEFTVDLSPPDTIWKVDNGYQGYEDLDDSRTYGPITVRAFCLDPDIDYHGLDVVFPWQGEFGCNEGNSTFTCMTPHACSTLNCTPESHVNEYDLSSSGSYCLCGYSQDKGFNTESKSCVTVRVDGDNPTLTLDSPYPLFATMLSYQPFDFSWDFAAGSSQVYLTWRSGDLLHSHTVNTTVNGESGSGTLTANDLYPGANYIDLAIYDETYTGGEEGVARISTEIFYDLTGPNLTHAEIKNSQGQRIDHDASSYEAGGFGENLTFSIDANDYLYKDPSGARTDDISKVEVTIIQSGSYASRGPFEMNNTGGSTFEYVFDPSTDGYLYSGTHTASYRAADNSYDPGGDHNTNEYEQNFTINETTSFDSQIYEVIGDTWKRIDQSSFAEFGSTVAFNATVSNPSYITDMDVRITCKEWCVSNFLHTYNMVRNNDLDPNFFLNLTPSQTSTGMFNLAPGFYNALFILSNMDGTSETFNSSFSVMDTMSPNYTITLSTPYSNADELPVITKSKTGSVTYYDVVVSSTEPVNISSLSAEISGADNLDLETFMEPSYETQWRYRIAIPIDDESYDNLYGNNAQFQIEGTDLSGNHAGSDDITSGRYFEIDTFGGNAPILNPDIENMSVQTSSDLFINGSTDPAEENISLNININSIETSTLSDADGIFMATRQMSELGGNEIILTPIDYLNNTGDSTERIVIFDNTGLQVVSTNPLDGEILPSLSNVSVTFYDGESLIVPATLTMTINGDSVSFQNHVYETNYLQMIHMASFPEGTYIVNATGENQAGITTETTFTFSIDPTIPEKPEITIIDGNYYDDPIDKWFVPDDGFDFDVDFGVPGTYMVESAALVEDPTSEVSCTGEGTNFHCSVAGPLDEGDYTVSIAAVRQIQPGTWSNPGTYEALVELDTTDPELTISSDEVYTNNGEITIEGDYSGLDTDDTIELSGAVSSYETDLNPTLHEFTADATLNAEDQGNYTVYVTAADKAGNIKTVPITAVYDNSGSPAHITNVRTTLGGYNLLQRNFSYYITNVGEERYGITIDGTAEPGTLEIWKSHEISDGISSEFMESSSEIDSGIFSINLTLGQPNGENYIRIHLIDRSGNPSDASITIYSDTTGADISDIHVEDSELPLARIGSTTPQLGVSEAEIEECGSSYVEGTLAWDSCQINRVLAGDEAGCLNIWNVFLLESCCSFTGTCDIVSQDQCTSTCSPALSRRCDPTYNAYDRCEDQEGDGCLEWVLKGYCDPGICANGSCI